MENNVSLKWHECTVYVNIGDNIYVDCISSSLCTLGQISRFFSLQFHMDVVPIGTVLLIDGLFVGGCFFIVQARDNDE